MNIAFWNTNRNKTIDDAIIEIVLEKKIDVFIFAEYNNNIDELCSTLNKLSIKQYRPLTMFGGCEKIKGVILRGYRQEPLLDDSRYMITSISASYFKIIFALIHAESKLNSSDSVRRATYSTLSRDVTRVEQNLNIKNTIIIGDLNANPFEESIIDANSLHALPFKEEAKKLKRKVSGRDYEMFYSPMWKLLSRSESPYGTYYYNNSDTTNYFWNIFDQVIFRPSIIPAFNEASLDIIVKTNNRSLLNAQNRPNKKISDHLPIFFELKEGNLK